MMKPRGRIVGVREVGEHDSDSDDEECDPSEDSPDLEELIDHEPTNSIPSL